MLCAMLQTVLVRDEGGDTHSQCCGASWAWSPLQLNGWLACRVEFTVHLNDDRSARKSKSTRVSSIRQ